MKSIVQTPWSIRPMARGSASRLPGCVLDRLTGEVGVFSALLIFSP